MRKNQYFLVSFLIVMTIPFSSCTREGGSTNDPPSRSEIILGSWILQSSEVKEQYGSWTVEPWLDCDKDNPYLFARSGRFTVTEGVTKCVSSDPDVNDAGNWRLDNDDAVLSTKYDGEIEWTSVELAALTDIQMILLFRNDDLDYRQTFKRP